MTALQRKNDGVLKAPQSLIHISHEISHLQVKILYSFIQIYNSISNKVDSRRIDNDDFFEINIKEISKKVGRNLTYSELLEHIETLENVKMTVNILQKDKLEIQTMSMISETKIKITENSSSIKILFPTYVLKRLKGDYEKPMFSQLNWDVFSSFKSKYACIIYKLCNDYRGTFQTKEMTFEFLREYLGVPDGMYQVPSDFKKWCIDKPVAEINGSEICDIIVETQFAKIGRSYSSVKFLISPAPIIQKTIDFTAQETTLTYEPEEFTISDKQVETLVKEGFSDAEITAFLKRCDKYISEKKAAGSTVKPFSILATALKDPVSWGINEYRLNVDKKAKDKALIQKQAAETAKIRAEEEQEKREQEAKIQNYRVTFDLLSDEKKEEFVEFFKAKLENAIFIGMFEKEFKKLSYEALLLPCFGNSSFEALELFIGDVELD